MTDRTEFIFKQTSFVSVYLCSILMEIIFIRNTVVAPHDARANDVGRKRLSLLFCLWQHSYAKKTYDDRYLSF